MISNFNNNIPIYIQLVEDIKLEIISGKLNPGDKLPSVREWANIFKVNPNTMQKALSDLEELGLVYTERTNGKYVTNSQNIIVKLKEDYIKNATKKYLDDMKKIGISKDTIINYINKEEK